MKMIYRWMAPIALALLLLTTACSPREAGLTSAEATALANGATGLPPTLTTLVVGVVGTGTPAANETQPIPVTGGGPPEEVCQFCMEGVAHVIVTIPETSSFTVATAADGTPVATCNSVETLNGRQVVLCYATTPASFNLNVCASDGACSDFVVSLQACPSSQPAPTKIKPTEPQPTPTFEPTLPAPTDTPPVPTGTPVPPTPTP